MVRTHVVFLYTMNAAHVRICARPGTLFCTCAIDYFISSTKGTFDWDALDDYVVGSVRMRHPSPRDRLKVGIRTTLLTTERRFWHCGDHTAKPESA